MSDVVIYWRGLNLGSAPFDVSELSGWLGLPGGQYESQDSTRGHGQDVSPVRQQQRIVLVSGFLRSNGGNRDSLVAQLRATMVPRRSSDEDLDALTITAGGLTRTALAQLINFDPPMGRSWAKGMVPWSAQWRCPDPRVFGADVTGSAPLVVATSGITLPQMLPFTLTAKPIGGTVTILNPGTDPEGSPTIYTLIGAQSGTVGLELVTAGRRVTYALTLGTSDTLTIDTERGGAFLNGEYRPSSGMSDLAADLRLLPGVNVIRALGSAGAGSPSIAVTTRPSSW